MYWPRQNELWVFLAVAWWMGSLIAWISCYTGAWYPIASADAVTGTALFIALISATLRLPILTVTANTTQLEDHVVWLLGMGANVNWIGMLGMRSESLWSILPAVAIVLAVELWMLRRVLAAGRLNWFLDLPMFRQTSEFDCVGPTDTHEPSQSLVVPKHVTFGNVSEGDVSVDNRAIDDATIDDATIDDEIADDEIADDEIAEDVGGQEWRILRTMRDEIDLQGNRHLSGEIFLRWQSQQKSIIVVVGFVPALRSPAHVDFDTESPNQLVRHLNCTQAGLRFEVKRSPPLEAAESMVAWSAIESLEPAELQKLQGDPKNNPQLRKLA